MNIALVLAGGVGRRMGQDIPKQFIKVDEKPIIIYTLLALQNHPAIDMIQVACVAGWEDTLLAYAKQYGITKLKGISVGGDTRFASTRCGIEAIGKVNDDDIIVIHDSVRPLVTAESLTDVIAVCKEQGNAMAVLDCVDTVYERKAGEYTRKVLDRGEIVRGQTPEAVTGKRMKEMYERAAQNQLQNDSISALQLALGWEVHFARGAERNIKLTRAEDIELFKALLITRKKE